MKPNKTQFHEEMGKWESDFADFKNNVFPKTYGQMANRYLPVFLILMSFMLIYYAVITTNVLMFLFSLLMLITGVFLSFKWDRKIKGNNLTTVDYPKLQKQISSAEHNYSMYPDVMEYLKKFKTSVEAEQKHKKNIKRNFWIMFFGFFVIFTLLLHIYNNYRQGKLYNHVVLDRISNVLELEPDVPFLILKPYKTNIDDSIKIESKNLSLYLDHTYVRDKLIYETKSGTVHYLKIKRPIVYGSKGDLRLTITDENGNPIPRCPCFVFDPNDGYEIIKSEYFLYTPKVYDDLSDLQTIETLRYLQANQEHLRFIVEKI